MKRSRLRRSTKPLKRSPISSTSKKRQKLNRIRTKVLKKMGKGKAICEICQKRLATDGHERLARSGGGSITDPTTSRYSADKTTSGSPTQPKANDGRKPTGSLSQDSKLMLEAISKYQAKENERHGRT